MFYCLFCGQDFAFFLCALHELLGTVSLQLGLVLGFTIVKLGGGVYICDFGHGKVASLLKMATEPMTSGSVCVYEL